MKTDVEQLTNILAQFDDATLKEVLGNRSFTEADAMAINKSVWEFDVAGESLEAGQDGAVEIDSMDFMERLVGHNNLLPAHFLEEGVVAQKPVAKVFIKNAAGTVVGYASGFMVSPSLFLTNNHVFGSVAEAKKSTIDFNYQDSYSGVAQPVDTYSLNPDSVFRTNAALDYTLVRVKAKPLVFVNTLSANVAGNSEAFTSVENVATIATRTTTNVAATAASPALAAGAVISPGSILLPTYNAGQKWGYLKLSGTQSYAVDQHLNIVQHPQGRKKEVGLQDNHVTGVFANAIRYQTDTEPGSSGSPVFNNGWELVALHHAAGDSVGGVWTSNEGMRIDKIVADLRSHFGAGSAVLTELGI